MTPTWKLATAGLAVAHLALAAGCNDVPMAAQPAGQPAAPAPAAAGKPPLPGRWISPPQALRELRASRDVFLLCVADKEQYDKGHIAGSVLIPVRALRRGLESNDLYPAINHGRTPRKDQPIIVYCWWKTCDCPSIPTYSELARKILLEKGYRHVAFINGGIKGWIEDDLPVASSPQK